MGKTYRSHNKFLVQESSVFNKSWENSRVIGTELFFHKPGYAVDFRDGGIGTTNGHDYTAKLRKGETKEIFRRQFRKHNPDPCVTCFLNHGKMWMLKGNGRKSSKKTKGLSKEMKPDLEVYP